MNTPLFDMAERQMSDASLEAWGHVSQTLSEREIEVFTAVARYLNATGYLDVTGGELAAWSGISILAVRPRLTGLVEKGWLQSGALRASRVATERRCHPVWLAVPAAAIERLKGRG